MTLLEIVLTVPASDGAQLPAQGVLRFAPTRRRILNGTTVLPKPFQVPLTLGMATVDLAANDPGLWVWRIDEHVSGTPARTIYTNIPDATSFLYTDLVAIDPASLVPAAELTPAWAGRFAVLEAAVTETSETKLDATEAATTYAAKSVETSKLDASQKGAADGVAPLGADSKVADANLPARLADAALAAAFVQKVKAPTGVAATDTANIQAAIDAGGKVQLQPGTYVANVLIKTGVYLSGAGVNATTIKAPNGSTQPVISVPNFATLLGSSSNGGERTFGIRDLTVDGNKAGGATGTGVALYGYYYDVKDLNIHSCGDDGFYSEWGPGAVEFDGMEAKVTKLHIHNNNGDGFVFNGPHDSQVYDVMSWYNGPNNIGGIGIHLKPRTAGTLFVNCHSYGPHIESWRVEGNAQMVNCIGEGGNTQMNLLYSDCSVIGGQWFASGSIPNQVGIKIGGVGVISTGNEILTKVYGCNGGSVVFSNSGGANAVRVRAYQATGTFTAGTTPNAADRVDLHFVGQTRPINTAASIQQGYGKQTWEVGSSGNAFAIRNDGVEDVNVNSTGKRFELLRGYTLRGYSDSYATRTYMVEGSNGHLSLPGAGAPTLNTGSVSGGSAPAPVGTSCSDSRGVITFGTGAGALAGEQVKVVFSAAWSTSGVNPVVTITPRNAATAALGLFVVPNGLSGFNVHALNAPAASQANTVYEFGYHAIG